MKLLLDACIYGKAKHELILAGHDVIWIGDWDSDPGDEIILAHAFQENRILITLESCPELSFSPILLFGPHEISFLNQLFKKNTFD